MYSHSEKLGSVLTVLHMNCWLHQVRHLAKLFPHSRKKSHFTHSNKQSTQLVECWRYKYQRFLTLWMRMLRKSG